MIAAGSLEIVTFDEKNFSFVAHGESIIHGPFYGLALNSKSSSYVEFLKELNMQLEMHYNFDTKKIADYGLFKANVYALDSKKNIYIFMEIKQREAPKRA